MYEYGVSFKSVRHLQEYGRFHFYSRYVIVFNNDEKSLVHMDFKRSSGKASKSYFSPGVSGISKSVR